MKARVSKLDQYATRLEEWFLAGKTLAEAQAELRADGCAVSLGRLSEWWQGRQAERQEAQLLQQIATGADACRKIEDEFGANPAPGLETLIKLHRVLILKLATEGQADTEKLELVNRMMREVQKFARLEQLSEQRKIMERTIALSEQKYRDEVAERKAAMESELAKARSGGITPETLERIEHELKLL